MTEQIETKSEKTPGDLKREEIAKSLGKGWQFYQNYPAHSTRISSTLEIRKKKGEIEDWRAEQPAFDDNSDKLLFSQGRAAYIKPKPDRCNKPWYKRW